MKNSLNDQLESLLVRFGNYLLSDERNNNFTNDEFQNEVWDADISNFRELLKAEIIE
jgi:hypothetical protein